MHKRNTYNTKDHFCDQRISITLYLVNLFVDQNYRIPSLTDRKKADLSENWLRMFFDANQHFGLHEIRF